MATRKTNRPRRIASAIASAFALAPGSVLAQQVCDQTIVGMGIPSVDHPALQRAIAGPHRSDTVTVCLQGLLQLESDGALATIDINPRHVDGAVTMAEINIVGVGGPSGKATINGGFTTLALTEAAAVRRVRIDNIRIEDATSGAILAFRTNDHFEVTNVDIAGVNSAITTLPTITFGARVGIQLSTFNATFGDPNARITGTVVIADNTIDAGSYDSSAPADRSLIASAGIALFGFGGEGVAFPIRARVRVSDNTISGWSGSGIAALFNNDTLIEDNVIDTGTFANSYVAAGASACGANTGIGSANGIAVSGAGRVSLVDNTITMREAFLASGEPTECAAGILLTSTNGVRVEDTEVTGDGASNIRALVLVGGAQNRIDDMSIRSAGVGISLEGSSNNSLNDISIRRTATCQDVDDASTGNDFDDVRCR